MRKRVGIVAVAAVVIGVAVYLLLEPRAGTEEWHKKELARCGERLYGEDWRSRLGHRINGKIGVTPGFLFADSYETERLVEEMRLHMEALRRLNGVRGGEVDMP